MTHAPDLAKGSLQGWDGGRLSNGLRRAGVLSYWLIKRRKSRNRVSGKVKFRDRSKRVTETWMQEIRGRAGHARMSQ